jgi:hypothetical protein
MIILRKQINRKKGVTCQNLKIRKFYLCLNTTRMTVAKAPCRLFWFVDHLKLAAKISLWLLYRTRGMWTSRTALSDLVNRSVSVIQWNTFSSSCCSDVSIVEHRSSTFESTLHAMYYILFTYGLAAFLPLHIITIQSDAHILRHCIKFVYWCKWT